MSRYVVSCVKPILAMIAGVQLLPSLSLGSPGEASVQNPTVCVPESSDFMGYDSISLNSDGSVFVQRPTRKYAGRKMGFSADAVGYGVICRALGLELSQNRKFPKTEMRWSLKFDSKGQIAEYGVAEAYKNVTCELPAGYTSSSSKGQTCSKAKSPVKFERQSVNSDGSVTFFRPQIWYADRYRFFAVPYFEPTKDEDLDFVCSILGQTAHVGPIQVAPALRVSGLGLLGDGREPSVLIQNKFAITYSDDSRQGDGVISDMGKHFPTNVRVLTEITCRR